MKAGGYLAQTFAASARLPPSRVQTPHNNHLFVGSGFKVQKEKFEP
jgi:hypothetical protein